MKQQTMPVGPTPSVVVGAIHGDLRLAGWDRSEILAKTDGEKLTLTAQGDQVLISCDESLILYLPRQAKVSLDRVTADATLQALQGPLVMGSVEGDLSVTDLDRVTLEEVSGDASFRNVGILDLQKVAGDLSLRGGRGSCAIEAVNGDASVHGVSGPVTMNTVHSDLTLSKVRGEVEVSESVSGDASVRDVEGGVHLKHVGSDLYLRNVRGEVEASAGADATLYLQPLPGLQYRIHAGGDLLVRLPADADAKLHLTGRSAEDIQVDFPGTTHLEGQSVQEVTLGNGAAQMFLEAKGELIVTSRADKWDSAADFGFGMLDDFEMPEIPGIPPIPPIPPIPGLSPELSDRINRRAREAVERAQSRVEAANRRAEARVAAAMRRAEAKAHASEARARKWHGRGGSFARSEGQPPAPAPERSDPVSDEERLTILKMLQAKKISLEEAERLLAALEGK
jgi:hypothetical protein